MSNWIPSSTTQPVVWPQRAINQTNVAPGKDVQWIRKIELFVYGSNNQQATPEDAILLTPTSANGMPGPDLRITFQVRKITQESPNMLRCRIYNLHPDTQNKILEYTKVSLSAGYQTANFGEIFRGTVVQYRRGKENATDTYLEIIAGDGDTALLHDTATLVFPGDTQKQKIAEAYIAQLKSGEPLTAGTVDLGPGGKQPLLRAMAAHGMVRDLMRDLMSSVNGHWWIDSGKVHAITRSMYLPGEAPVLTPSTGLVGIPEVTPSGIQAMCLLNPKIVLGGSVKIETSIISGVPFLPGSDVKLDSNGHPMEPEPNPGPEGITTSPALRDVELQAAFTSPTGIYKVLLLEHSGDTRGNPWYSTMVCVAIDKSGGAIPSSALPYDRTIVPEVFPGTWAPAPSTPDPSAPVIPGET